MHHRLFALSPLACALLVACSSDSSTARAPATLLSCADVNLNGRCDTGEERHVLKTLSAAQNIENQHLLIQSGEGFILSAPKIPGKHLITPFTTLIQNELLFNPLTWNSGNQTPIDIASDYLDAQFPGHNFKQYLSEPGPRADADKILTSLKHTFSYQPNNKYCAIAATVDKMVATHSFSVQLSAGEINNNCRYHSARLRRLNSGFQGTVRDFDSNSANGVVIAIDDNDEFKTWFIAAHTVTAADAETEPSGSRLQVASHPAAQQETAHSGLPVIKFTALDDDDDYYDYDDDDDDDDDYDSESGASDYVIDYPTLPPVVPAEQKGLRNVNKVIATLRPEIFYALSSSTFGVPSSTACGNSTEYGAYRINLALDDKQSPAAYSSQSTQALIQKHQIDAVTGASGIPYPNTPPPSGGGGSGSGQNSNLEAHCLNNGLQVMVLSPDQKRLLIGSNRHVFSLDAENMQPSGGSFTPISNTADLLQIASTRHGEYAAIVQDSNAGITLVNGSTLQATGWPESNTLSKPGFFDFYDKDSKAIAFEQGGHEMLIFDLSNKQAPTIKHRIDVGAEILHMGVSPNKHFVVIITEQKAVRGYSLPELSLSYQFDKLHTGVKKLLARNDGFVILEDNQQAISSFTYKQGIGSPVSLAAQMLTESLILAGNKRMSHVSQDLQLPSAFTEIPGVSISWHSSSANINTDTGAVTTSGNTENALLTATISGSFRGENVSITRLFPVILRHDNPWLLN